MAYNGIKVAHIVATDLNGCIGKDGKMPWHIPADLKRFRELTEGGVVIMGRKTFESLGCKPLPDRQNIIVTENEKFMYDNHQEMLWFSRSIRGAMDLSSGNTKVRGLDCIWIIGGAEIYAQTMQYVDVIEHTLVYAETIDGDAWYNYEPVGFIKSKDSGYLNHQDSSHTYRYFTRERK